MVLSPHVSGLKVARVFRALRFMRITSLYVSVMCFTCTCAFLYNIYMYVNNIKTANHFKITHTLHIHIYCTLLPIHVLVTVCF